MTLRDKVANELSIIPDGRVRGPLLDRILALIAAEKARGPDPLLVQAREALEPYVDTDDVPNTYNEAMSNAAMRAVAALDEYLRGKP